jgi:hypothetical protein
VIVNAHLAGGHGLQRNRLLIRAKEMEQKEQDDAHDGVDGDGESDSNGSSSSGSSSNGTTNSSSNSDTESSTDEETATNKVEVGSELTNTVVVPYVGEIDAQKSPISPPPTTSSTVVSTWHAFLEVADWDRENKRVMKLALPYLTQAFLSGVAKAAVVAIIGKYYGTRSLTAFVVIEMTVGLTTEFFGGE